MSLIRLDKLLADSGFGTRSGVKNIIKSRKVLVNNNIVMSPDYKVDTEKDIINIGDHVINYNKFRYYMFNKPAGCISATEDNNQTTIFYYFKDVNTKGLFPIGRLDKDTEGLLIVTNDGELSHKLLSPVKHVNKTYFVRTDIPLSNSDLHEIEKGVDIGEKNLTLPCVIFQNLPFHNEFFITISEGKFHQIKRMFKVKNANVTYLRRLSMGPLCIDNSLNAGEFRELSEHEISLLKNPYGYEKITILKNIISYKKAVLFDLDGTVIDSMWMWKSIDKEFLEARNIDMPENLQKSIEGKSFHETAVYFKNRFSLKEEVEEIKAIWNKMALEYYEKKIDLKPGVLDFLHYLKANNYKTAIATSNSQVLTNAVLKALNIFDLFNSIITSCQINKGKPAPDIYLKACEELQVIPDECVVFEDIPQGILAGKNAGIMAVAVEDRYSQNYKDKKTELADFYIQSFTDLLI